MGSNPIYLALLLLLLLQWQHGVTHGGSSSSSSPSFDVVGYLPEYRTRSFVIDFAFQHLSDIILFSIEPEKLILGSPEAYQDRFPPPREVWERMKKASKLHGTRILVGLGGAGRSSQFGPILHDKEKRAKLVKAIAEDLIAAYELDGIDLNVCYCYFLACFNYKLMRNLKSSGNFPKASMSITCLRHLFEN
jgi:hypothetical protein